ncbi:MAG: hypothetical protein U0930_12120 [Pirellulales bacterium]
MNSKCQRLGVCNTCESLLIHRQIAANVLSEIVAALVDRGIEIRGDEAARRFHQRLSQAAKRIGAPSISGPIMAVALFRMSMQLSHCQSKYGSHHADAIVTNDLEAARKVSVQSIQARSW